MEEKTRLTRFLLPLTMLIALLALLLPASHTQASDVSFPTSGRQTSTQANLNQERKGMTWYKRGHIPEFGVDHLGCSGCDPYQGDTVCSTELPILCLKKEGLPNPGLQTDFYHGWTGGHIGLTLPIAGNQLTGIEDAALLCEHFLGSGYQMASHHDGNGGWNWYAYGHVDATTSFWTYIRDQDANCWGYGAGAPAEEDALDRLLANISKLTITKSGPATVIAGAPITYTLTVSNLDPISATNSVIVTDTLPTGASYVSGGTLVGNVVGWTVPELAPSSSLTVTFVVTATQTITNSDYRVTADGGYESVGKETVVTIIPPPDITVSPSSLSAVLAEDNRTTETLTIGNVNTSDLHWTISSAEGANNALEFDGVDDYVELTDFTIPETFTAEMWVNPSSAADRQGQSFIGKHTSDGENIFVVGYWGSGLHVRVRGDGHTEGSQITEDHHLAVVVEKMGSSSSKVTVYRNAHLLWQHTLSDVLGSTTGKPWVLGQDWDDNSTLSDFFEGVIDEVRIWNKARTPEEIRDTMNHRLTELEDGLIGYWRFDEGLGTTVADTTANSNHGTVHSASWLVSEAPLTPSWLAVTPLSGNIAQDASMPIAVTFDATNLTAGTYTDTLTITSNDPDEPTVEIPLSLTVDGTIATRPGNCNGHGAINAADISCLVLELFDGDGKLPTDTPGGTFPGTAASDANEDGVVDAADISCTVRIIFGDVCGE